MAINAELFNGTILEFPDGTDPSVIRDVVKRETAKIEGNLMGERTWGEAATDVGASLLSGVGSLAQMPGQLGTLAGMYSPEEAGTGLQGMGKQLEQYGQSLKSEPLKQKEAERAAKVGKAEGFFDELTTAVKETAMDPALLTSFFAEQVPNLIGSMGAGLLTKAGLKVALRNATEEVLQKSAVRGMVGANAAMQGADVGADTYERLYDRMIKDGVPKEKAAEEALGAARMAAIEAATISVGTTMLPGGTTIERALVGRGLPRTGGIVKGLAGEALSEGVEEGGGRLVSNIQERGLYPETDIMKGVGEATGMGALMGGAFGGLGGATLRAPTEVKPPEVPPTEVPPSEAPPSTADEEERIRQMEEEEERRKGIYVPPETVVPPAEAPPVETPPTEAPPAEPIPPKETVPPAEAPPVETVPPTEAPPVEQTPPEEPPPAPPEVAGEMPPILHPAEIAYQSNDQATIDEAKKVAAAAGVDYRFDRDGRIDLAGTKVDWNVLKKTKTAQKLLDQIRDFVPMDTREIIDRIAPYVKHIPVSISQADVTNPNSQRFGWQGVHTLYGTGKEAMHAVELYAKSSYGNSLETITHELIHGATVRNYFEGRHYNQHSGRRGDQKFAKASKELDELADYLMANHGNQVSFFRNYIKRGMSDDTKTSTIARELLSWGLTNKETREQLKSIVLPNKKTAWSRFVTVMRHLLQLPENQTTALTKIIDLQDKLTGGALAKPYKKPGRRKVAGEVVETPAKQAWHEREAPDSFGREEALRGMYNRMADRYDASFSPKEAFNAAYEEATPAEQYILRELAKDDLLGFDYPHQAIRAIIEEPGSYDLSRGLKTAISRLGNKVFASPSTVQETVESPHQTVSGAPINAPAWAMAPLDEKSRIKQLADTGVYNYIDKFTDLKQVIQAINKTSKKLSEVWDAYMRETLYHGRVANQTNQFLEKELKPLAQEMVARNVSEEELNAYRLALHAEEYNNVINERNDKPELQHRGSGVHTLIARAYLQGASPEQVQKIKDLFASNNIELNKNELALLGNMSKMTPEKRKALESVSKRVDKIVAETQDIAVRGGIEKQSTIDYWRDKYPHYSPLKRTQEELDFAVSQTGMGHGFSTKAGFGKAATGSLKTVENILSNIILQRDMAIVKAEKARIGRAIYAMALQHPNTDFYLPVNPNASIISKANDLQMEILRDKDRLAALKQKIQNDIDAGRQPSVGDLKNAQDLSEKIRYDNERHKAMVAEGERVKAKMIEEIKTIGYDVGADFNENDLVNLIREPQGAWYNPDTGKVEYRTNSFLRSSANVLAVPINGETRYVFFNPGNEQAKRMVRALKELDVEQIGAATAMAAKFTRWISSVNTQYNPFFGIVNMIRDVQGAQFNLSTTAIAGKQWDVTKRIPSAVSTIFGSLRSGEPKGKYAEAWAEFQRRGGPTGIKDSLVNIKKEESILSEEIAKLQEAPTKSALRKGTSAVFNLMSDFNDTMENAVRLSAFIEAREKFSKTMSPEAAADKATELAKNLTVNFNRKGAKTKFLNSWLAFFNASMQGSARMWETLTGPSGKKIMGSMVLLGVIQQMMLAAAGFDEDDPPEFVREKNFVIPTGDGKYLSWPMPLGFSLFVNLGRISTSAAQNGGENIAKDFAKIFNTTVGTFSPVGTGFKALTPTVMDPFVSLATNVDDFGRPIYREDRPGRPVPGYLRSTEGSTAVSKFIAQAMNRMSGGTEFQKGFASPTADEIDYLAGYLGGGTWREARKVVEYGKAKATGEDVAPYRVPFAGRFQGDTGSDANVRNRFYERSNQLASFEAEIKGRLESGQSITSFMKDHPEANLFKQVNAVETKLAEINKARKELIARGADPATIKSLNDTKIRLMKQFNESYDRVTKTR